MFSVVLQLYDTGHSASTSIQTYWGRGHGQQWLYKSFRKRTGDENQPAMSKAGAEEEWGEGREVYLVQDHSFQKCPGTVEIKPGPLSRYCTWWDNCSCVI